MEIKAKADEMYKEWKSKKEGFLKEVKDVDLVRSPHSYYSLPCFLGDSHKQSQNDGLRLLTKIDNKGKGLRVHEQSMVEPVKVKARPLDARLGVGEGECSHAVDANNSLK